MQRDVTSLFSPQSIAVIGASRSPEKVGAIILQNIIDSDFSGKIYPINPNAKDINGIPCYTDIQSLPEVPDLAVIAVPAEHVVPLLAEAGIKGIKNVVVISAGFKEIGEEGIKREKDLVKVAEQFELNVLGPNCLGFVNNVLPVNVTFGQLVQQPGNVQFISQSGAIASSLFDWSSLTGLGFDTFVTLGNKAVLNENDVLSYFQSQSDRSDSSVSPVGLYLESISDGPEFLRLTKEISRKDPVLILKPGKTKAAASAMQSHTGAIAGEDDVLDAVLKQAGVIRCTTIEDLFDYTRAFAWERIPTGPRVAVVSNAGGPAVISADAVVSEGLVLAEFDAETSEHLKQVLPRSASIVNPVDVLGDALADRYAQAVEIVLQTDAVDSVVVILTPQIMTQIEKTAAIIGELSRKYQKPIMCSFIGGSLVAEGEKVLNSFQIPSFGYPEQAIAAIGVMYRYYQKQQELLAEVAQQKMEVVPDSKAIRAILDAAIEKNQKTLDNIAADTLLQAVGITTPKTANVTSLQEAKKFVEEAGWPVVLKLSSPGLLHKKEVGGVITDIMNDELLDDALLKLENRRNELPEDIRHSVEFQIQEDIQLGVEVIVGVKYDPTFGHVLLFGAGGSYAELIEDRNLYLLPIDSTQAENLVKRSKIFSILSDREGEPPYALDALYETIVRLSVLATSLPEVQDIEINPVIVTPNGVWAVDGKVILKEGLKKRPAVPQFRTATVLKHDVLATKFNYYEFETETPLVFKAGQYVSVKVADNTIRAYSIAAHDGPNTFSLLVDTRPGGPGSQFFEKLKSGDKMTYMGPFGLFMLHPDDGAEQLLFLSTGSGTSAIRCMIDEVLIERQYKNQVTFYFGLTHPEEVFWKEHFDELVATYPNFSYSIVVCEPDQDWKGCTGYVTKNVAENFTDARNVGAYLCGHQAMMASATELLIQNGCPKERIYSERFS